jgi:hypothetical protein
MESHLVVVEEVKTQIGASEALITTEDVQALASGKV